MPELLDSVHTHVVPPRWIVDGSPTGGADRGPGGVLHVEGATVCLVSAVFRPYPAAVTVEVWSAEPPPPGGRWEAVEEVRVESGPGRLWLADAGGEPVELRAGQPGEYQVRAFVTGRRELLWLDQVERIDPDDMPAGCEQFHVQVWPAPESDAAG